MSQRRIQLSFNRTIVELKFSNRLSIDPNALTFNRTIVELKFGNTDAVVPPTQLLLIVP